MRPRRRRRRLMEGNAFTPGQRSGHYRSRRHEVRSRRSVFLPHPFMVKKTSGCEVSYDRPETSPPRLQAPNPSDSRKLPVREVVKQALDASAAYKSEAVATAAESRCFRCRKPEPEKHAGAAAMATWPLVLTGQEHYRSRCRTPICHWNFSRRIRRCRAALGGHL